VAPPDDLSEITSSEAMVVVPASCLIDHKTSRLHIAPVSEIAGLGAPDSALPAIRKYDCHHEIMYLPAEDGRPERIVELRRMLSIEQAILEVCDRQSQCTSYATRLLMRKLVLLNTGNQFPYWTFDLRPDDFPGEEHLDAPQYPALTPNPP
jgi:hypothetical protein